jgi:diaminopimelate epimerase
MTRWPPRPKLSSAFYKAHGLGNDYLVFEEGDDWLATDRNVRLVCDRYRGVGSDGIVVLLRAGTAHAHDLHLRMFNPDGGEFERSGNGLRVLGSFAARRWPEAEALTVHVGGDRVEMVLHGRSGAEHDISVQMGHAVTGPEAISLDVGALLDDGSLPGPAGQRLTVVPVSVGNPHLVVVAESEDDVTDQALEQLGPFVATHPALRHGANMQLACVLEPGRCRALIWERGVGRTAASGTSACAVAVALVSRGDLEPGDVRVEMPGGHLGVQVASDLSVILRGPVEEVCEGRLTDDLVASLRTEGPS